MNSELPVSADALLAERARLEDVLQSSEDWCELLRLKSRKDRGEGMSAVNAARLEMVLIDALAEDPNFIRYKAVCVALERLIRGLPPLPPKGEKPSVEQDDLTEIDGISASMQRRLNALDVTTFMQIAEWTPADIKSISTDLGLRRQIYEQDWIGQAEELATRSDELPQSAPPPKPTTPPKQSVPERSFSQSRVVETRSPPPPFVREAPRPALDAKADVRAEPVVEKPVEASRSEPTAALAKDVTVANTAPKTAEPQNKTAATPERNTETLAADQSASAKHVQKFEAKPVAAAPASLATNAKPLADPPRPLKAVVYQDAPDALPTKDRPQDSVPAPLLHMPPSPLRVQTTAPKAPSNTATATGDARNSAEPIALGTPPRPFVVTRESLPPAPKVETSPAATAVQGATKTVAPAANPPPAKPSAAAFAQSMSPQPTSAAPSMSISEAIAYAAEVARQSPKTSAGPNEQRRDASAPGNLAGNPAAQSPVNGAPPPQKFEPARPPVTVAQPPAPPKPETKAQAPLRGSVSAAATPPAKPPPLPDGFVSPPDEASSDSDYRGVNVQSSRHAQRDDGAGQRLGAEEATVEIVVKSAPELRPTPRATLTKVAGETTAANAPRPATPIGRFLKALTGS